MIPQITSGAQAAIDKLKEAGGFNNFFNTNTKVISMNSIEIGDHNLFGPNVVIVDQNHKY